MTPKSTMSKLRLKTRILVVCSSIIVVTSMIITTYLAHRAIKHSEAAYEINLANLSYTTRYALESAPLDDKAALSEQLELLTSSTIFHSITIVDDRQHVVVHTGNTFTPPVNPKEFPQTGQQVLDFGQFSVFIQVINAPEYEVTQDTADSAPTKKYWMIVHADRTLINKEHSEIIRFSASLFFISMILSFLLAKYLEAYLFRFLSNILEAVDKINTGAHEISLETYQTEELEELGEKLSELAGQLHKYRTDIRDEIEQTTQDLRETLETIEIQNVELDIARKNAVNANNAKSEFLANMSHEIRTPLNGIIGFARILMRSSLNAHQSDTLRAIQKSSEILLLIINDILDFSKVEAGRINLEKQELDLYELIEDIVVMLAPSAHQKGLELNYLFYNDAPRLIKGDSLRLKQIITNLINNAIKFTEEGEIVLRVMLDDSLNDDIDNLKISVSDTGIGLSAREQTTIFKAFSQADASTARQFGGTGLGLSICKGLVTEMGGEINFESEFNQGSTFWFSLPLDKAALESQIPSTATQPIIHCDIYEPHMTAQKCIAHILNKKGFSFTFHDNLSHLATSIEQDISKRDKGVEHTAIVSLKESVLLDADVIKSLGALSALNTNTLLFTPTLNNYDYLALSIVGTHLLKPITLTSLTSYFATLNRHAQNPHSLEPHSTLPLISSAAKVLAVDDNEMNLSLVKALLSGMGVQVVLAASAEAAITLCQEHYYPLVLMDIQMPDMDGVACMQEIRRMPSYHSQGAIIALTAYALPREKDEFIKQGFDGLITKPIDEQALIKVLETYLPSLHAIPNSVSPQATRISPVADSDKKDFDWKESCHLANGNEALANEFYTKLCLSLPAVKETLLNLRQNYNPELLLAEVHKLHGVTLLCGAQRLRTACRNTEHSLKTEQQKTQIEDGLDEIINAIDALFRHFEASESNKHPHLDLSN